MCETVNFVNVVQKRNDLIYTLRIIFMTVDCAPMAFAQLDQKAMLGHKIRRFRNDHGLSQTEMAAQIGISPSYLNLIEHNQRPVTVPLLFKLGQAFEIDLKAFAENDDQRLAAGLAEVFGDPVFNGRGVSDREIREFVSAAPSAAQGMLDLFQAYRQLWESAELMANQQQGDGTTDGRRPVAQPVDEVRDFLERKDNHFDLLERAAEELWATANLDRDTLFAGVRAHLRDVHGVDVKIMPPDVLGDTLSRFDLHRKRVLIAETLLPSARLFHLGIQLALLEQPERIDAIVEEAGFKTAETRALATGQLAGYFAGALMMPYSPFLEAAKDLHYDIERLRRRFNASFEQICHRLTTMQRPGDKGVPFFFLRVDNAGNVSKRLDGGGFHFARFGGTCPRLVVHDVFRRPGQVHTQLARLPDGTTHLILARALEPVGGIDEALQPSHAVALGCDIKDAEALVYGKGINGKGASGKGVNGKATCGKGGDLKNTTRLVPIGVNCRVCERIDCTHRAHPPVNHKIRIDPGVRKARPFEFVR